MTFHHRSLIYISYFQNSKLGYSRDKEASVTMVFKVGIMGGSGLEDPQILQNPVEVEIDTPFGKPSDKYTTGTINGVQCILLSRHGKKHDIMPGNVNYRANMWGFMKLGASVIIASTACGSLQEHIEPGHLVFPDSVFDRTNGRKSTFFDNSYLECPGVCHIQLHPVYHPLLRKIMIDGAKELGYKHHVDGFGVCIEGPRFSTKAESKVFRSYGASLVNMTMMPECALAKELGIPYVTVALVTDYDCWKEGEHVSMEQVMTTFKENSEKAKQLIVLSVQKASQHDWTEEIRALKKSARSSVMISPDIIVPHLDNSDNEDDNDT
ncbi:unnamed protein product [Auanema sp. JU1783]|nr:unnamed protein product [Auanema sp. JU1783]